MDPYRRMLAGDKYDQTAQEVDQIQQWINPDPIDPPKLTGQSMEDIQAQLREAIAAGDRNAANILVDDFVSYGFTLKDLPPDLRMEFVQPNKDFGLHDPSAIQMADEEET